MLNPKSVASIAKLEKAKARELASKLGHVYTAKFSVQKYNCRIILRKRNLKRKQTFFSIPVQTLCAVPGTREIWGAVLIPYLRFLSVTK